MLDDFAGATFVACYYWDAAGHGFEDDEAEGFGDGGVEEDI